MLTLRNITAGVLAGAVFSITALASAAETSQTKPNVIMVFTDDMGFGDLSSFSDALPVKTPNIDKIASQGTKFRQFYVAMPICSPSRAAVLSGTFSPESQLTNYLQERKGNYESDQNDYMKPERAFLPKSFKAAGYATGHVGKWHLGGGRDVDNAPSILKYGYDEAYSTWESPNRDPKLGTNYAPWDKNHMDPGQVQRWDRTRYMVDKTLDFLKRHKDQPAFITLWPDDLHTPFRPSPKMRKKYGGKKGEDNSIENFYAVLDEYDRQMGRLYDGLKEMGIADNTIFFFTGDNGPAPTYDHKRTDGMRGAKLSLYEGGIREPLIFVWPGKIPAGKTNDTTVIQSVDFLPTLTTLAGIEMLPEAKDVYEGEDLSKAILGADIRRTKPLMWEYGRTPRVPRPNPQKRPLDYSPALAIRDGDYKLLVNPDGSDKELYNIVKDRMESNNLAKDDQYTSMVQKMAKQVIDWQKTLPHRDQPYPVTPKSDTTKK